MRRIRKLRRQTLEWMLVAMCAAALLVCLAMGFVVGICQELPK